jgi:hypothetical protein
MPAARILKRPQSENLYCPRERRRAQQHSRLAYLTQYQPNPKSLSFSVRALFRPNRPPTWRAVFQFTNLRNLTPFTKPSIRKIDQVLDPPELIRGSGIPVIGIFPTTIPTFTST